ncbi:MAG TPA: hypothetical protein PLQ24_02715 [Methanothrix sp.]|nr:hypothetical protein [Methanothrix sp.]HNU38979.1 hypothetical protein [Methanothrix sp.]HPA97497.1 hypothetical protein [Methanothrix sp.]
MRESWGTDIDMARISANQVKTGGERKSKKQTKMAKDIPGVALHQTAPLAPLKVIEIKKKRWWQFWR